MSIKRQSVIVSGAIVPLLGAPAIAEMVRFEKGPGNTSGGIFIAMTDVYGTYDTFCLETGEGLTMDFPYDYTIGTDIMYHGSGTVDPLNEETALLYTEFRAGNIPDILGDPTLPDDEVADAMQLAIWFLEEGFFTDHPNALFLVAYAEDAVDNGAWSGLGDVRVMNVWDVGHAFEEGKHAKQDVLVLIPAPPGLAAIGLGIALAWRRRRA